jgi:Flp pilus assembly protein TadG
MGTRVRSGNDTGSMSIGLVIVLPILMLALGASAQYFVKVDAERTAAAAAEEGAAAARRFDGSAQAGQAQAHDFLSSVDNDSLENVEVSASRSGTEASVTVTGTADSLGWLPFLDRDISETSTGPVERYTQ